MNFLSALFDQDGFLPHGMCILWQPELLILHSVSDALITLSYYSIPIGLISFVAKRRDIEFRWMFVLFGTFILACGTSHLFGVMTLWWPYYGIEGLIKAVTAITSLGTAALMWRIMPMALAIPGKQQLEAVNRDLEQQIGVRREAERSLTELNRVLEDRVHQRTAELERTNEALTIEIDERRRAELVAHENEQRFRNLIEGSVQAIIVHRDGVPVFANQTYAEMFGARSPDEILALKSVMQLVAPDEVEGVRARWAALRNGETPSAEGEVKARRIGGEEIWVYIQMRAINWYGAPAIQATLLDITDRKHTEERLRQAQRMEAVGHLTGGLAHDFNNLIAVVMGNLELISDDVPDNPRVRSRIDAAARAAQRGADLTRQLLAFSRQQPLAPRTVDVNALVSEMVSMLSRTLGEDIEIVMEQAPDLWPAIIDPAQLGSAIANLANNARDAMPEGGNLRIETRNIVLDADDVDMSPDIVPGDYVALAVSDNGAGMSQETLARVFEPFFTTKSEGRGTGLGLSMVFGFIKQSGGHIKIYSEIGAGTTVRIYLRRAPESGVAAAAPTQAVTAAGTAQGETILVVEDNPAVRATVVAQLESLGYTYHEAENGAAALALLRSDTKIDLLFTDIMMPGGMSGRDLAREAAMLRPGLRVLFTSGFLGGSLQDANRIRSGDLLLSKPYRKRELALKLREVLDRT